MIGLVLTKFIKKQFSFKARVDLMTKLQYMLKITINIKYFLDVPNYLHFLHELININETQVTLEEGYTPDVLREIAHAKLHIMRAFTYYTLFLEDRAKDLLALFEFDAYLKPVGTSDQGKTVDSYSTTAGMNFFHALPHLEHVLNKIRTQLNKAKAEDNQSDVEDKLLKEKKNFLSNISQFLTFYENFVNNQDRFEQEHLQLKISKFTCLLFDVLYTTNLLYIVSPSVKYAPNELNSVMLARKYDGVCHRNGGLFLSMLTILFAVLKHITISSEKITILKCLWQLLSLRPSRKGSEGAFMLPRLTPVKATSEQVTGSRDTPTGGTLESQFTIAYKRYKNIDIRQQLTPTIVDYSIQDKSSDILLQKVNVD